MIADLIAATALPIAWVGVGAARRYALRRNVLDRPTSRSSHLLPTPRGGGIGVVASILASGGAAALLVGAPRSVVLLGALAVAAVAIVGWLDDHASLSVRMRLVVHIGAALAVSVIAIAAGVPSIERGILIRLGVILWWALWTVSAINVVNFIDGIDGMIGAQFVVYGIFVSIAASAASIARPLGLAVAAASLGFLRWNWAPARIFLGDVGSGAYGIIAVLMGIALLAVRDLTLLQAFLPLAPIFLDAATTIVRRARRGERVTVAHRSHLYQRLANGPWSHARTAAAYACAAVVGACVALAINGVVGIATDVVYIGALAAVGRAIELRLAPWPTTSVALSAVSPASGPDILS